MARSTPAVSCLTTAVRHVHPAQHTSGAALAAAYSAHIPAGCPPLRPANTNAGPQWLAPAAPQPMHTPRAPHPLLANNPAVAFMSHLICTPTSVPRTLCAPPPTLCQVHCRAALCRAARRQQPRGDAHAHAQAVEQQRASLPAPRGGGGAAGARGGNGGGQLARHNGGQQRALQGRYGGVSASERPFETPLAECRKRGSGERISGRRKCRKSCAARTTRKADTTVGRSVLGVGKRRRQRKSCLANSPPNAVQRSVERDVSAPGTRKGCPRRAELTLLSQEPNLS